jgi:hypothetical protein
MRGKNAQDVQYIKAKRVVTPSAEDETSLKGEGRYRGPGGRVVPFTYSCAINTKTGATSGVVFRELAAVTEEKPFQPDLTHVSVADCDSAAVASLKSKNPRANGVDNGAFGVQVRNADGLIVTPPQTEMARSKGYPVIIDYFEKGLKIIGPGTGVARAFMQKNPNTLKIFLMGYLDGVKRSLDDPTYAKSVLAQSSKITDQKLVEESYQEGVKVWNKDMTVDPEAIKLVLEQSTVPKANELDVKRFFDNTLIKEVNRDYASKLFPGQVK